MGIVLFWVHDPTPSAAATRRVVARTAPLVVRAIGLTRLPVIRRMIDEVDRASPRRSGWSTRGATPPYAGARCLPAIRVVDALRGGVAIGRDRHCEGLDPDPTRHQGRGWALLVAVSDGTGFDPLQAVHRATLPNYATELASSPAGCTEVDHGKLVDDGQGPDRGVQADEVRRGRLGGRPRPLPDPPKQHSFEYLREVAHLRPRTNTFAAVTRVRHCLAWPSIASSTSGGSTGSTRPSSPPPTPRAPARCSASRLSIRPIRRAGGGVDLAQDFFGKEAHLTVSGQLNVETYCLAMSRVYTFGPTFRAENSNTTRHLAEFWMVEPEIAFADLADDADLAEEFLGTSSRPCSTNAPRTWLLRRAHRAGLRARLEGVVGPTFERIPYTDAVAALGQGWTASSSTRSPGAPTCRPSTSAS